MRTRLYIASSDPLMDAARFERLAAAIPEARREKLAAFRNGSESPANLMLYFLQNCNYYNQQELSDFRKRLLLFERMSRAERLHAEALALFSAGRLSQAYDRLKGARDALNTDLTRTEDPAEKAELLKRKAGYYCDMAAVCLRLFEDKKAEDLLHSSELYAKLPRARLMLGLMGRAENLSEEEQAAVDARLSECRKKALSSESYQKTADLFDRDRIRAGQEAGERIRAWQNDYRRML